MDNEQHSISRTLEVTVDFDAALEARRRIDFLSRYLRHASCRTFVLGISGGVDSLAAGLLAQTAVSELRAGGYDARLIAVRLPYGVQADETDAWKSQSDRPRPYSHSGYQASSRRHVDAVIAEGEDLVEPDRKHFHLGNIKARQRMIAQYALAGSTSGLVIGTDQAAEDQYDEPLRVRWLCRRHHTRLHHYGEDMFPVRISTQTQGAVAD